MNDRAPVADLAQPTHLSALAPRYRAIRAATEALAAPLSAEDCAIQSMPDASPVKWHLAHTTWFFETFVLEPHRPGYRCFDPAYRVLFNSYYYRDHVDAAMRAVLAGERSSPVDGLIELGLHHEQQHAHSDPRTRCAMDRFRRRPVRARARRGRFLLR